MQKFSFYKGGIKNTDPVGALTMAEAVALIGSDIYKGTIELLRSASNDRSKKQIKDSLAYFTFSGTFKKRQNNGLLEHSGYLCLDFDDVDPVATKAILCKSERILACFVSPGGNGIKAIVKIEPNRHAESFAFLAWDYELNYQLKLDPSGKDIARACYVSYDPEIYYNPDSITCMVPDVEPKKAEEKKVSAKKAEPDSASARFELKKNLERAEYVVVQAENNQIDLTGDYSDWQMIAFSLATLGEDGRQLFHRVSRIYSGYNEQEAEAKFTDALTKGRFTKPGKFFSLAKDYGLEVSLPKNIAEKKEELTYTDFLDNPEQVDDMTTYGFYIHDGCYHSMDLKGKVQKISNFLLRIIYHVQTSDDEAYRLIHIKNIFGHEVVLQMNTDDFVSVASFKKLIARKGNFIFKGGDPDLCRLQDKLQRDEVKTELVKQLGYNKRYNFYAFANGLYDCNQSQFFKADDLGIVNHYELTKEGEMLPMDFFIPAMSKMYINKDDLYVNDKRFIYLEREVTFKQFADLFCRVFGDNGKVALIFYVMCLFSDIVFKGIGDRFPMLNVYGQKATGKGTIIEILMKLWGRGQKQVMLGGASTIVGFMRKTGQYCNAAIWLDEYKNNLNPKIIESLKNFYDRIGYERGKKDNSLQTESTRIDSGVIISGQEMPIVEEALFSRFIQIITVKGDRSEQAMQNFDALKVMEGEGLSNLTVGLLKHRQLVASNFKAVYEEEKKALYKAINNRDVDDRFINNYASLIAMCAIVKDVESLPFSIAEFREVAKSLLLAQFFVLKGSDSIGKWWAIVEVLFNDKVIQMDRQFTIKDGKLYIRVQDVYQSYAETMLKRKDAGILDEATLRNYLQNDPKNFKGSEKKFFGGSQRWCLVFDYEGLGIDLIHAEDTRELKRKLHELGLKHEHIESSDLPF